MRVGIPFRTPASPYSRAPVLPPALPNSRPPCTHSPITSAPNAVESWLSAQTVGEAPPGPWSLQNRAWAFREATACCEGPRALCLVLAYSRHRRRRRCRPYHSRHPHCSEASCPPPPVLRLTPSPMSTLMPHYAARMVALGSLVVDSTSRRSVHEPQCSFPARRQHG